ncbi:MAG: hypothetical protein V1866_02380 [archaeon]
MKRKTAAKPGLKAFIAGNRGEIAISIIAALLANLLFIFLKAQNLIVLDCPVSYLNPWQYFFYCSLFHLYVYLIVFALSFALAFGLVRISRLIKN